VASADRQGKLVERPAETFEQKCAADGVISQQSHASFSAGEPQDGDLVLGRLTVTGHDELHTAGVSSSQVAFATKASVESP
jgi:hypothetical protein